MIASKDLKVGHIIVLNKDEQISADLMVLEIAGGKKECYVETKNLDGETNLKVKEVPEHLHGRREFWFDTNFECLIDCGAPNKYLEDFHGSLITS